jgi:hypothetical protein
MINENVNVLVFTERTQNSRKLYIFSVKRSEPTEVSEVSKFENFVFSELCTIEKMKTK